LVARSKADLEGGVVVRITALTWTLLLLTATAGWGQKVTLPAEVKGEPGTFVTVKAETDCAELKWLSPDGLALIPPELLKDSRVAVVSTQKAGRYRLYAYGAKGDKASDPAFCTVVVGDAPPVPPGPTPVPPGPTPPGPVPPPVPIPATGFRVVFVVEAMDNLTREQLNTLNSTQVREYLNRKCVKDADGKAGWRMWDDDVVITDKETATWKALWSAVKPQLKTLPALVIVNDTKGEVFPLPSTEKETLDLLKKFGGE
jgi:hypothetical protein